MVWGMALPDNFGEFWPSGDFEYDPRTMDSGWFDRLKAYFKEHVPDERKALFDDGHGNGALRYAGYVAGKFVDELSGDGRPPFTPVEPHEVPRSFDTEKGYSTLGSLIMLNSRMVAVDEALKAIIERLEPRAHQFFPLEIRMPKGKVYPASYYLLAMRYLDAFSHEDTKAGSVEAHQLGYFNLIARKAEMSELAMRKVLFGDAQLWRARRFSKSLICFSDAIMVEIEKAGLRIPKHYKLKEI